MQTKRQKLPRWNVSVFVLEACNWQVKEMQTYTNLLHVINCTRRPRISVNDRKVASKSRIPYAFSCGYVYRGYFLFRKKEDKKKDYLPRVNVWYCSTGCASSEQGLATPSKCGTVLTWGVTNDGTFFAICILILSSCVCCLRSATCAAITRCLSAIRVHWAQLQSRHLQYLLWPLSDETTPWLRQRAHFGVRGGFRSEKDGWITYDMSAMSC